MIEYADVAMGAWHETVQGLVAEGFDYLDLLTAVDRPDEDTVEVVLHLVRPAPTGAWSDEDAWLRTSGPRQQPSCPTVTDLLPAAMWHEREAAEMFGIRFIGHPDPRPLLLDPGLGMAPLRKDTVLVARVAKPWPGAHEGEPGRASSRRRQAPPGVPVDWLREDVDE